MKTILVDAVNAFVSEEGEIFEGMHKLLETYPNEKIVLTNADEKAMEKYGLNNVPYPVFTLRHDPEKTDPEYFRRMLSHFGLKPEDVVYFEHSKKAVESARSIGIESYHYDPEKRDLQALKAFLDSHL